MMKFYLYTLLLCLAGCMNKPNKNEPVQKSILSDENKIKGKTFLSLPKEKVDRTKFHTTKSIVIVYVSAGDTLRYSREEFNDIVDNFPELYEGHITDPDTTYARSALWVDRMDSLGNVNRLSFGSEQGQDQYYMLYAYFLQHKNGIQKYAARRKKLLEIYYTLNNLFGQLQYGGTYFGHQYSRIKGYAEFSLYWFRHYEDFLTDLTK